MKTETIDMTPTWEGVLPIYLTSLMYGKAEGKRAAEQELQRMAKLADLYIAAKKGGKL